MVKKWYLQRETTFPGWLYLADILKQRRKLWLFILFFGRNNRRAKKRNPELFAPFLWEEFSVPFDSLSRLLLVLGVKLSVLGPLPLFGVSRTLLVTKFLDLRSIYFCIIVSGVNWECAESALHSQFMNPLCLFRTSIFNTVSGEKYGQWHFLIWI